MVFISLPGRISAHEWCWLWSYRLNLMDMNTLKVTHRFAERYGLQWQKKVLDVISAGIGEFSGDIVKSNRPNWFRRWVADSRLEFQEELKAEEKFRQRRDLGSTAVTRDNSLWNQWIAHVAVRRILRIDFFPVFSPLRVNSSHRKTHPDWHLERFATQECQ